MRIQEIVVDLVEKTANPIQRQRRLWFTTIYRLPAPRSTTDNTMGQR